MTSGWELAGSLSSLGLHVYFQNWWCPKWNVFLLVISMPKDNDLPIKAILHYTQY